MLTAVKKEVVPVRRQVGMVNRSQNTGFTHRRPVLITMYNQVTIFKVRRHFVSFLDPNQSNFTCLNPTYVT